ncbi:LTA synthase family protein [uncultured Clostridium sp.]|uniref:LTA synthase family protein n=1 Tax=uncultured Clostridium sp. TaxID=59620 RepID=UPI0025F29C1D|nr:LTA synthase family protein [uncultured Clostridium sp.]
MNKIINNIKDYFKSLDKDTYIKIGLFIIPLIGIIFKNILLQGFIQNQDPYTLDFSTGYANSRYFLKYYLAFTLIFFSFSLLFKGKGRVIYLFVIDIFLTALILLDVMYFRGFLTVPSVMILTQTANLDNLGGSIMSMLSGYDILFFFDFIILAIYVFLTRNTYKKDGKRAIKTFIITLILSIMYIGYVPFNLNVLNNEDVTNAYLFDDYDPTNTCKYFSSVGYHIFDIHDVYVNSQPYTVTEDEKAAIDSYYSWKNEDLPDNEYAGISKDKNLIVIQVESLESFILGKEINGQKITPNLDKLLEQSYYFPNIYEQVNEGTSSDCDLMINTSMLPLRRGGTFFRYPNTNYNSLPKILKTEGYESISIHPDKGSFWNYANALKGGIGFENFIDYFSFDVNEQIGMGISDKSYFEQVVPKLKELSTPFFAHTITLTNHGPFDLPDELRKLSLDSELNNSELGGYFESVHYTDAQIGHFLELLDKEGILDNTTIIITGDHTGVHKYYNSSIQALSTKEDWYLDDGEPRVPFIIYDKSITEGKTFDTIGGQIDIMPTMLYLLGVDSNKYENTALGRNLLNTNRSYAVITNGDIKGTNLSDEDKIQLGGILQLSDSMIRGDYFNTK